MAYKHVFCTVSTESHLFKCHALAESIAPYGGFLNILVVDAEFDSEVTKPINTKYYSLNSLDSLTGKSIIAKYKKQTNKLRWSLKPIFLQELLKQSEKVIYLDNDTFFYNDFCFLFEQLDEYDILLSPHHYPHNPEKEQNWFEANFRVGLFNAGFVAVNQKAINTLNWWAKSCLYRCEKNYFRGLYDDQKYLDLFPVLHPNTKILEHKGCNAAAWNEKTCKIELENMQPIVNGEFKLIFYHFSPYSLNFLIEEDFLFQSYLQVLLKYKPKLQAQDLRHKESILNKAKLVIWNILNAINARK